MTLDTHMYVHDPVDAHELFHEFRRLLGATTAHPWDDRDSGDGVRCICNAPGIGLPAWVSITYRSEGPLHVDGEPCTDACDPDDDYHHHLSAMWCVVSMDTTYGYRDAQGRGCSDLHACYVATLGRWLDARGVRWSWVNEFTGDVHGGADRYERLRDLGSGGRMTVRALILAAVALAVAAPTASAVDLGAADDLNLSAGYRPGTLESMRDHGISRVRLGRWYDKTYYRNHEGTTR